MEWIGVVQNEVAEPTDEGWGEVVSEVVLDEMLADGLDGIEEYSHVLILYWMHRAAEASRCGCAVAPRGGRTCRRSASSRSGRGTGPTPSA